VIEGEDVPCYETICGLYILFCCIFPFGAILFILFVWILFMIVFLCPPLAILISAGPFLKAKELEVYSTFENEAEQKKWHQIGWVRAFFLCSLFTIFGYFPGVFFAAYFIFLHFVRSISN
jgi:uncharacterized membrane protein YqaE (UPF0057 family)